jgi:hypothetical protein
MRRVAVLASVVALGAALTLGAASPPRAAEAPLLALVSSGNGQALVRVDPATLGPVDGPTLPLGSYAWPWAYSPDRARVAFGLARSVEIVDPARMRVVRAIGGIGNVAQLAWLAPPRLVAVYGYGTVVLDPTTGRRVGKTAFFSGDVVTTARAGRRLLVLVAPYNAIGRARLIVVDSTGRTHSIRLRIRAGADHAKYAARTPALVADGSGSRAFVVGADSDPVAEIRLAKLAVTYHVVSRSFAKGVLSGPTRYARWVGNGLLAVAGDDAHGQLVDGELLSDTTPSGLELLDTRTWRARTVDPGATRIAFAAGRILAYGATLHGYEASGGMGLGVYAQDGTRVAHLFATEPVQRIQVDGTRAFVDGRTSTSVVDLGSGAVVGELPRFAPDLLLGGGRGWND